METTIVYWSYIGDNGKESGKYRDYWGYIRSFWNWLQKELSDCQCGMEKTMESNPVFQYCGVYEL